MNQESDSLLKIFKPDDDGQDDQAPDDDPGPDGDNDPHGGEPTGLPKAA